MTSITTTETDDDDDDYDDVCVGVCEDEDEENCGWHRLSYSIGRKSREDGWIKREGEGGGRGGV